MAVEIYIASPKAFSFERIIDGHGWSRLAPFAFERETATLCYVFENAGEPIAAAISADGKNIKIEIKHAVNSATEARIRRDVRHILRFDDDLQGFYQLTKRDRRLAWIGKNKAGRLLRSPTVYEDLVKTLCTTNCSWALTVKMTANLVGKLGAVNADGARAFPTAERMADAPEDFYRNEIRAGYRSPYFIELAQNVASGAIDPESWLDSDLPTDALKKEMKKIKGVGNYAAETLLKLVGRYDGLALDSMLRARFYRQHNAGEICADRAISEFYEPFADWRGLAIWCDLTGG